MYKLKVKPEDFIVRERSNVKIKDQGRFSYFKLTKKNRNTLDVVKEIAKQLGIKEREIGFAGSKDKHAITEQLISIPRKKVDVDVDGVSLEFVGQGDKPISLGDLKGNEFEIVISDYEGKIDAIDFNVNYFDEQRFSKNNAKVGKHLVKKEFKEACSILELKVEGNNFIGALTKIPIRMLRMYVNAYQSYLWNETVAKILSKKDVVKKVDYSLGTFFFVKEREELQVPLIGFGSKEFETDDIKALMEKEGIRYKDFVIKQIHQLTLEGEMRDVFIDVNDFKVNGNKVFFFLQKGSYATMVIRRVVA
ncbi:tRNA pseudouridine(13) synthase TruD [Candidatus Woesearchaeota archaeon]|jgi:tRNA pseudouridine13 synthase|nr:tRNA pseudouridine(13) synthase TruD [Candidatus Woesearchaeota archaeon]MBT4434472.1 tRNA pseudouridine(13) synthase TruD [Candidatus Woesearchaeota archaeon]MBT7331674.1 tRNA pseudouridine(13) synthase TruD [Candidatus Woesearchaeota archaeon]